MVFPIYYLDKDEYHTNGIYLDNDEDSGTFIWIKNMDKYLKKPFVHCRSIIKAQYLHCY